MFVAAPLPCGYRVWLLSASGAWSHAVNRNLLLLLQRTLHFEDLCIQTIETFISKSYGSSIYVFMTKSVSVSLLHGHGSLV